MENQQGAPMVNVGPETVAVRQRMAGASDLLGKAISIYREKFIKLLYLNLFAFLAAIPLLAVFGLYFLISGDILNIGADIKSILQIILGLAGLFAIVLMIFYNIAVQASFYLAPESASEERAIDLLRRGRAFVGRYFGVSILVGLFTILWTLLLIIPGIIMSVYYSLAGACLIYEGHRATSAIKRSKEITKGYWWALAGRYLFFSLVMFLFYIILSIPSWLVGENSVGADVWAVVTQIISYLIAPLGSIYAYYIFRDLQSIKGEKKVD